MAIVTRRQAVVNLNRYINQDLSLLAPEYHITTYETGRQNKGWKGLVLERLAGLENSNARTPDGFDFELKSVSFRYKRGILKPKETMAITMINEDDLINQDFFSIYCWHKLKSIVFCVVLWHGQNSREAELIKVIDYNFSETDSLTLEIKEDYDYIRHKLIEHGYDSLTGRDGTWIQARTKGSGHGSTSRAFYARKALIEELFEES